MSLCLRQIQLNRIMQKRALSPLRTYEQSCRRSRARGGAVPPVCVAFQASKQRESASALGRRVLRGGCPGCFWAPASADQGWRSMAALKAWSILNGTDSCRWVICQRPSRLRRPTVIRNHIPNAPGDPIRARPWA